jgi:hypothetical protein
MRLTVQASADGIRTDMNILPKRLKITRVAALRLSAWKFLVRAGFDGGHPALLFKS